MADDLLDPRAAALASTLVQQKKHVPNLAPLHADTRAAPLPRGCRFRDLGEAHRNITGRSISASYGAASLAGSVSGSTDNADAVPSSRDITSLSPAGAPSLQQTPVQGGAAVSPVSSLAPSGESRALPELPMPCRSVSPLSTAADEMQQNRSSGSQFAMTVDSRDTAVRLYRQYQAQLLDSDGVDSSPTPGPAHAGFGREGAAARLDFRHDAARGHRQDGPDIEPLPQHIVFPVENRDGKDARDGRDLESTTSVGAPRANSLFLTVPTRESLLYPKPLRVQSIRAEEKHVSLPSGIAVSATGMTSDSEDDPFRYDKDPYKIFLHPSKERDVSAALNHISGLSPQSRATLHSYDDDAPARIVSLRPPPIPKKYLDDDDDPFFSGPTRARSPTPESADGFYDTSVIQPNWAVEQSAYEVKVVLQDTNHTTINAGRSSRADDSRSGASEKPQTRASLAKPKDSSSPYYRQKDKENGPSSERDDWETVATSALGHGSTRLPHPLLGGGRTQQGAPRGTRMTGSSVADISDDGSFCQLPFDEYASTDRIVQHPSEQEDSEESLQIRNMRGKRVPVIVPKQRVHRVNGFAQGSPRTFSPPRLPGSDAAAAPSKEVASPFRQLISRRPHRFSPKPFQPFQPFQPVPYKLEKGKNRFEFRHYSQISDGDARGPKGVYEFQGVSSDTGHTQSEVNNTTASGRQDELGDDTFSLRDSGSSRSSGGTVHSFPFPLISLPEAARMQAANRTVSTEDAATPPYRAKNERNRGRIRIPERSHQRSPAAIFASAFTQSSTQSSHGHNRLKKRRTMPKDLTMKSAFSSTTAGGTWATILPFGSSSTRHGGPARVLKTTATRLRLDELGRKFQQRKGHSFAIGSSVISRSNTPRLYPWDYYPARRRQQTGETDPELQAIALAESEHGLRGRFGRNVHDLERSGVPLDPEAFLSWDARRRRRIWFHCMLAVSMFPFISVLVYLGKFDSGLSWFTRGEVCRLNARQRQVVFAVMVVQFVLWPMILALVIWRAQQLSSTS